MQNLKDLARPLHSQLMNIAAHRRNQAYHRRRQRKTRCYQTDLRK